MPRIREYVLGSPERREAQTKHTLELPFGAQVIDVGKGTGWSRGDLVLMVLEPDHSSDTRERTFHVVKSDEFYTLPGGCQYLGHAPVKLPAYLFEESKKTNLHVFEEDT